MPKSWSFFFSFGKKSTNSTIASDITPSPTEQEPSSPLCCKTLAQSALRQSPTYWPHAPKYQNRLKGFLTWIDTNVSSGTPEEDADEEWVEIASDTDLYKADFVFRIIADRYTGTGTSQNEKRERFFIPLSATSFTEVGHSTSILTFNSSSYLSTGNTIRLACPDCKEGESKGGESKEGENKKVFQITLLVKKGRTIDIQLIDISNAITRQKVKEMKGLFPEWRVDELRSVFLRNRGGLKEAVEEVRDQERDREMRKG